MKPLTWILFLPFKLLGHLFVALGTLAGFLIGAGLIGGGVALTLAGPPAIVGVPAIIIGVLVLRELFDTSSSPRAAPAPAPAPDGAVPHAGGVWVPPPAAQPVAGPGGYWMPPQQPRVHAPHYAPRAHYYYVPGRWTIR